MADDRDRSRAKLDLARILVLAVKVTARATTSEVLGLSEDGSLRVKVAAVPEKGKANEELRSLLSRYFGVGRSKVEIVSGETSTRKRVRITI